MGIFHSIRTEQDSIEEENKPYDTATTLKSYISLQDSSLALSDNALSFKVSFLATGKLAIYTNILFDYPKLLDSVLYREDMIEPCVNEEFSTEICLENSDHSYNSCPLLIELSSNDQVLRYFLNFEDGQITVFKKTLQIGHSLFELMSIYTSENNQCVVCLEEERDILVTPCKHLCMCWKCAGLVTSNDNKCPVCRTKIEKIHCIQKSE